MATVTLPNGLEITDVSEQTLKAILSGLEDGVHYNSGTKGRIKITDMATPHLRNAVAKALRESLENAKGFNRQSFVSYLKNGVGAESITTIAMIQELAQRID